MDTPLNLPSFEKSIKLVQGQKKIFDRIRKKYVVLTPEEWVRQHFINFLIEHRGYPMGLMAVEQKVIINGMPQRVDIVTYSRNGKPLLVVECKAPELELTQETYRQAARYNLTLNANYLVITNGKKHFCSWVDTKNMEFRMLNDIPNFKEIAKE
jgi:hypothetical protein